MRRYGIRDDQWERIRDLLPGQEGHVGVTAADNRVFVEAVLYRYRTGMPWRDLPERFGDWKNVHQRFSRWAKSANTSTVRVSSRHRRFLSAVWVLSTGAAVSHSAAMALCRAGWLALT